MIEFRDPVIAEKFNAFSDAERRYLLQIRALIFQVAKDTDGCGEVEESLKWGMPSYASLRPVSGTPIRLGVEARRIGLYVHCQTTLVESWRAQYSDILAFSKNRAILLDVEEPLPERQLSHCIAMALTYHLSK